MRCVVLSRETEDGVEAVDATEGATTETVDQVLVIVDPVLETAAIVITRAVEVVIVIQIEIAESGIPVTTAKMTANETVTEIEEIVKIEGETKQMTVKT